MSKVASNKVPFEIQVEEHELAEWFLKRIPQKFWHLWGAIPTVTDSVDTRDPALFLRIVLDKTPQIRIADARGKEPEAPPIDTTHELRNTLLARLRAEEKQDHDANHGSKNEPNCWPCTERQRSKSARP
jgi:hypothetical protein